MIRPRGKERVSKVDTYLNCAEVFAYRSTCIKRKYGAVIVKDDVVISTGYNGAPRGFDNCCDLGTCPRIERGMHQGEGYGRLCGSRPGNRRRGADGPDPGISKQRIVFQTKSERGKAKGKAGRNGDQTSYFTGQSDRDHRVEFCRDGGCDYL